MPGVQRIRITGTNGNDTLTAVQPGEHHLEGLAGDDKLVGGAFNDSLYGGTGRDVLDGGGGDDRLYGGEGADMLIGGTGSDTASYFGSSSGVKVSLVTGRGSGGDAAGDTLTGIENLYGSDFADVLVGDAADNFLGGAIGDDSLYGGGGNDWLRGGAGADYLDGGSGSDTLDYRDSTAISVDLKAGTASGGHAQGDQFTGIENVFGSNRDDTIVGDAGANILDGRVGDDMLFGGGGADILYGGAGDDTLEGGAGADVIDGSWDVDTASYATSNAGVEVNLETGLAAGGHAQGDVLSGIENLTGSAFGDRLTGSDGDNVIQGGSGTDWLRGGAGADQLWGGAGDDTFVFDQNDQPPLTGGTNFEAIGDFAAGGSEDALDLTNAGTGFMSLGDVLAHSTEAQGGTLIDLGPSGQVYLAGVGMASLTDSDFIFV
jgi:Ca2+-binding RTX toxin-like protein